MDRFLLRQLPPDAAKGLGVLEAVRETDDYDDERPIDEWSAARMLPAYVAAAYKRYESAQQAATKESILSGPDFSADELEYRMEAKALYEFLCALGRAANDVEEIALPVLARMADHFGNREDRLAIARAVADVNHGR